MDNSFTPSEMLEALVVPPSTLPMLVADAETAAQTGATHCFAPEASRRSLVESIVTSVLRCATYFVLFCVIGIFAHIIIKGAPVVLSSSAPFINTGFLTQLPETLHVIEDRQGKRYEASPTGVDAIKKTLGTNVRREMTVSYSGGGILGPIVGTLLLVLVCIAVALVLGVGTAIYLCEYAKPGRFIEMCRLAILNLAGVPSVVFGLFGLGAFVLTAPTFTSVPLERSLLALPIGFGYFMSFEGWGTCVLSGAFTLAFVILPVIITASEECLRAVPQGFRDTSLALGGSPWQTIRKVVLPYAMPGILTASILGIARAAGETAPIMFTAALAFKDKLPWQGEGGAMGSLTESVQALPYHIYTLAARIPQSEYAERAQYGSVFVFLVLVLSLAMSSVLLRRHLRAKYTW